VVEGAGAITKPWAGASEPALIVAAKARDQGAFAEIVRRRQGWVRGLLRKLCNDHALADDLAQEAFIRAWERLGDLETPLAFPGWMRRVAVTAFLQSRRRTAGRATEALDDADPVAGEEPAPDRAAGARIDLDRALARLSEAERLCVTLNHGEGLAHADIAALTGLPLGTVKSHVLRGVEKMRRFLGAESS
jgi:RNA polymerase sigma-70 factor (ECF subfamily)